MSSNENTDKKNEKTHGNSGSGTGRRKKASLKKNLHVLGAFLTLAQAVTAAVFIYLLSGTGMIPWNYVLGAFGALAGLVLIAVILVSIRNQKTRIAAVVVSILAISVQLVGSSYLYRTMNLL